MKVIKTQIEGCNGSCMYRADQEGIEAALMEVRVYLEESEAGDRHLNGSMSVAFDEMTVEEFTKLPDFAGY